MNAHLPQRCVIALLASMILALVIGLLAWGPAVLHPATAPLAPAGALSQVLTIAGALAMVAAGLWGLRRLDSHPQCLPWSLFFVAVALAGPAAAWHQWVLDDWSLLVVHLCASCTSAALMCAFLAERVDARWARWPLLLLSLTLSVLSACHWLVGQIGHGEGDRRGLLLLQWLPLLLVPAGALRLPGRFTAARDWYAALALYALALLIEMIGGSPAPGPLPWALVAGWLAYRAGTSTPELEPAAADDGGCSTKASTSLNTSG